MSDSQIGARKGKNIRNHIWVVNGIICDVLSKKNKKPIDIQIYDYKQCFDTLWIEECLNDFYDGGLQNEKLALLYNVNKNVKVAVKTPVGKTPRGSIHNVIIQGDVFGPLLCSKQVDSFGKECIEENKYTYMYKGEVEIPPLGMVDDLICVSECGYKTTMLNSFIRFKTNEKKLQFGIEKCKKMHVGKYCQEYKCQKLSIDSWKEVEVIDDETRMGTLEDIHTGTEIMKKIDNEKYLGDVLSNDGRNIKNIKTRVNKGIGIVNKIISMLDVIPFGSHYFEIALVLRSSLLTSSMLCNSESWYNITVPEMKLLETVDTMLLRKILKAPKSTPIEMLYLELGCIPYQELIQKRRLMFLHYILQEDPKSMIAKFFETQRKNPTRRDWVTMVKNDLEELKINLKFEDIKVMKKSEFRAFLKRKIQDKAIEKLEQRKKSHSKVSNIQHGFLEMQTYLKPNKSQVSKEERQLIFELRSRVTEVKMNFKTKYEDLNCKTCKIEEETQKHILECTELDKKDQETKCNLTYEKLFSGNTEEKVMIARIFRKRMEIREND